MEVPTKRSLRTVPPTYSPSLVFSHGSEYRDHAFCTLSDGCYHMRSIPEMRQRRFIASCYGWLIMQSYNSNECYLFNPISFEKILLPDLTCSSYYLGALTCPPTDTNCVVVLITRNLCIFCRIGDMKWIERELVFKEEDRLLKPATTDIISCQGKIYLFFFEGIVVVDIHGTFLSKELHYRNDHELSLPFHGCNWSFYVESCGEIFKAVGVCLGVAVNIILTFDVFKLDMSTMVWERVKSLGDRIFLLGRNRTSISATEFGLKGNCIYFTAKGYTRLYRFDMDDGTITITLPCARKLTNWREPFWVVPNCKLQVKKEVKNVEVSKNEVHKESWTKLPTELLELIISFLSLGDCIHFRLTCKSWMCISPPLRQNALHIQSECRSRPLPWLLSFPKSDMVGCKFTHPIFSYGYIMNFPELAGAMVLVSKYGWLLMSQANTSTFFFNPFTTEIIKLPDPECCFLALSFSSPPTSSDCIVFGQSSCYKNVVRFSVYRVGEDDWKNYTIRSKILNEFIAAECCNPVFFDGSFYCLGVDGKVGNFCPKEEEWKVLPVPALVQSSPSTINTLVQSSVRRFIVEYNGEIISVFVGLEGEQTKVYKLDQLKMKWERLESLGDKVMFLSQTASLLVSAGLKGIENRIYFPRFHGEHNVFYSLSSGNYHCFGSRYSHRDWINTSGNWHSTWFQLDK